MDRAKVEDHNFDIINLILLNLKWSLYLHLVRKRIKNNTKSKKLQKKFLIAKH